MTQNGLYWLRETADLSIMYDEELDEFMKVEG